MFAQHFAKKAQVIKCFCGGTKSARISLRGTKSASGYGPRGTKSAVTPACVTEMICITQITLIIIDNALLIYNLGLPLASFDDLADLLAYKHRFNLLACHT